MTKILGISSFYHDSSASLIINGEIINAVQEERFTRIKHDPSFPVNSIKYILKENEITLNEIDFIVFYEKPFLKFERLLETYVANSPRGFKSFRIAMPIWLREKLFQKIFIVKELKKIFSGFNADKLMFSEHHISHASSAYYPSPFNEAVILTLDGVGEWSTTTISLGKKNKIKIVEEIQFPHSIGLLYSAFTYYLGFKVNSGEYKVMGLAPYGRPIYKNLILKKLIDLKEDGSFRLDQSYFNYSTGLTMTNKKFSALFGKPVRRADNDSLTQFHMDVACSIQEVIEIIILKITKYLSQKFQIPNLCLAGGVALNCVANSKILEAKHFKNIWIQPASGDAGGSLGSALYFWHNELNGIKKINKDNMKGSFLGPYFNESEIKNELIKCGGKFEVFNNNEVISKTVEALTKGKAVGWFQGKMEFGPRSLGSRSIIADPRSESMQKNLNLKIKYRESFRPFAPAILREDLNDWFNIDTDSPYMLFVSKIKKHLHIKLNQKLNNLFGIEKLNIKRSKIPAVTHVDYSARVQTVHKKSNPKFHLLISKFKEKTKCPILVNTSFNVRGEPIVCTPTDAFKCFMGTELDMLVIENFILIKANQNKDLIENYKNKYELD